MSASRAVCAAVGRGCPRFCRSSEILETAPVLFRRLNLGSVGSKAKSGELNSPWKRVSCVSRAKCCPLGPAAHRSDVRAKVRGQQWLAHHLWWVTCLSAPASVHSTYILPPLKVSASPWAGASTVARLGGVTQGRHSTPIVLPSLVLLHLSCAVATYMGHHCDRIKSAAMAAPATS